MDSLTRITLIGTLTLLVLLGLSLVSWDDPQLRPRIWQLNDVLKDDPKLAEYPYGFRVVVFHDGIATVTRPFGEAVSATTFLGAMDPSLAGKPPEDPAVMGALERYSGYEARAVERLRSEPDIQGVDWLLDRAWLDEHGIDTAPLAVPRPMM